MTMPGRTYTAAGTEGYRYGFNGKEQDKETTSTTTYDYGFRIYSPALGRFLSVDPLFKTYPWNSTYAFAENDVIRSIDLDGLEKYIIHQRSFAPWEFFGEIASGGKYKYSGDHRGFTVASDDQIKSKVSTAITVDIATAKAELTTSKQFGSTVRYDAKTGEALKTAPRVNPEVSMWNPQKDGNNLTVKARIEGKAPLAPLPILDPVSSTIDQPIVWTGTTKIENHISQGYINITYNYIGKGFPALESFIEDEKGTKLFMGINISPAKSNIVQALSGSGAYGNTFKLKIATDSKGNFQGVYGKDAKGNEIVINPAAYNKIFEAVPAAKDLPKQ